MTIKNKTKYREINVDSFYWNSIRQFDTIFTICTALTSKLEDMATDFPEAIIDLKTIASLLSAVVVECSNALEEFETMKTNLKNKECDNA